MEFSIEIFTGICMTLVAVAAALKRAGFVELPYRKKWPDDERGRKPMSNHDQRPECADMFKTHARKLDSLEEGKTRNETNIQNQEKILSKGEEHFKTLETTMTDFGQMLAGINVRLEYLVEAEKKKNGGS